MFLESPDIYVIAKNIQTVNWEILRFSLLSSFYYPNEDPLSPASWNLFNWLILNLIFWLYSLVQPLVLILSRPQRPVHCGKPEPAAGPALTPGGRVRELTQGWRGPCAGPGRGRGGAGRPGGPQGASTGCLLLHISKMKIKDAFKVPRAPSRVVI